MPEYIDQRIVDHQDILRPKYGEYVTSFISENGEVIIDFFQDPRRGFTAWIRFKNRMKYEDVTDEWIDEMHDIARRHGHEYFVKCFDAHSTQ